MNEKEMNDLIKKAADSLTPSREEMVVKIFALAVIGIVGWRAIKAMEKNPPTV